ncbi:MAG: NusG domain II-containing protein [Spirochaetia bacterium]|jgi:hypothetical protein|nr:NusG domain II-containing protein [Spirochaetia bacterium]
MKTRLRAWDACALALGAALSFFSFLYAYGGEPGGGRLYIQDGTQTLVYSLDEELEVSASGPLGETRIALRGGEASVLDSPCRDKLCISMGHIGKRGGWIACLPNRVFLRVEGQKPAEGGDVDAASY